VTATGQCLCGAVRYEVRGPLRDVLVCHCNECRRWSGHQFAATAALREDLALLEERGLAWIESPESDSSASRGFCRECGSALFWDAPGRDTISIAAGSLDAPTGLRVAGHVYAAQAGDYYDLPEDGLPRSERLSGDPAPSQSSRSKTASSLDRLGTETAFEVLARAKALEAQGRRVIHLEIGEPDFETPAHIVEAAAQALRDGHTHYCPAPGLPVLREACAAHLSQTRGLPVDPASVLVGPGAKPFLFFGILATCEPGDEVVYPNPGFPIYESVIRWAGATPVPLPLVEEQGFAFSADDLVERLTPRTKLVILNSPANPTGGVVDRTLNAQIAALLAEHGCWILSDEVYSELIYDADHDSVASHEGLLERTILLDGFSKTFAMTGFRLGYAAVPSPLVEPITRLLINSVSCTAAAVQLAGVAALTGPREEVRAMLEEFRRRRDTVVAGLNTLPGVSCVMPHGAFYAFPNVQATGLDARHLADLLLDRGGVAVLAGTAFGEHGEGYLRLSYANSLANLEEALDTMRTVLETSVVPGAVSA
jgi:aspartate aminotransferase